MTNRPKYLNKPISTLSSLSAAIHHPEELILEVLSKDNLYRPNPPIIKSNGTQRITYTVDRKLKVIQQKINKYIFSQVKYPTYLQGSIKDKHNIRTYDNDARIHAGSDHIISEDVSNFFHSIKDKYVYDMWKFFFQFTPEISHILTSLTTYKGFVPQGSPTSSYIANLILWDVEAQAVEKLNELGINYTRYIDDITMSVRKGILDNNNLETAISIIFTMLKLKEVTPNREKHSVMKKSKNMQIHKLIVNSGRPTLSSRKRNQIRMEVFNLNKLYQKVGKKNPLFKSKYNSVVGRVRELSKFHRNEAKKYQAILNKLKPNN